MAQNAKIAALTDELIQSILNFSPETNKQAYKHAKEIASRSLRGHQYARTNQFEIKASFAGLDEKFRIKSRDDLADALQSRLQKLESVASNFKPEVLSLLLQLADRPLENTQVEALELLRHASPPPPLTWSEMLQEDPYSDEDIWKDIDYAGESSGDERTQKVRAKTTSSPPTSVEEDDTYDPQSCVVNANIDPIKDLEKTQFWNNIADEDSAKVEITELQAIQETLFMLAGLRTSLYQTDKQQYNIRINSKYVLSHAMQDTLDHLLTQFTSIGKDVYRLRQWTKKASALPLIQTFEASVQHRLLSYDQSLAMLQQHYLTPDAPISVSLLGLLNEVEHLSVPISRLAQIVTDIEPQLLVNPFSHLEALFDQTTLAQMTIEKDVFEYMSEMFFECLQTYLKPIRKWMEDGELGPDDETFFVFVNDSNSDAASLWHDRYVLRHDGQDNLRSPTFLQPAITKIFNTGKSVVFLKELGIHNTSPKNSVKEPRLDHETVCGTSSGIPLSAFPELFQAAFSTWIRSKYSVASTILRQHIFETGGLMRILTIFETLYLSKNGAVFEGFADVIFERMDTGRRGWNDRYVLTELAHGIFCTVMTTTDAEKVVVRSIKAKSHERSVKELAAVSIDYAIPWSIQNIIQRSSIPIYQQLYTFLLQIYRVKYQLQRVRPTRTHSAKYPVQLTYKLQHRLTWFTDTLRSYLTETVIFFTTEDMRTAMEKAQDIDEMSQIHTKYVAKLQERAMLSKDLRPIHKAIVEILDLGVRFAETVGATQDKGAGPSKSKHVRARRKQSGNPPVDEELSDSDANEESDGAEAAQTTKATGQQSTKEVLHKIDGEFTRLLPFTTAGLKSVGRVGAEPMWEQLAERLDWEGKRDRI
ncbi:Nn.00g081900.m01.CDS01 [Neocucurbitaria sp. VM-36]